MARPLVSVIMPVYNNAATLVAAARSMLRQTVLTEQILALPAPAEVVVCDDASGDETPGCVIDIAARNRIPIAWVCLRRNGVSARARNSALRRARGDVVLLLGDDIEPAPGLLERHWQHHRRNPEPTGRFPKWRSTPATSPTSGLSASRSADSTRTFRSPRTRIWNSGCVSNARA